MKYGPIAPKRLPEQDMSKVMLLAERWDRAAQAHDRWAIQARQAVDFFEGRQWTSEQLALMEAQKRPALTFNVIAPLVRLILGYQRNNKTDITYQPGDDARSNEEVADVLTKLEKSIGQNTDLDFVDTEVFMDGIICGRGFYDDRLCFENNDLGEIRARASDPFATYIDPDADTYNLNETASFVQQTKFVSIDEIEANYGKAAAELIRPFTMGQTPTSPIASYRVNDEVTPIRGFANSEEDTTVYWDNFHAMMGDFVDTHRKTIRLMDTQHKVTEPRNVFIDLETGDKQVIPEHWNREKIEKVLAFAEMRGNPLIVQRRAVSRLQWTTLAGDMILFDRPSAYQTFTVTPYFPYFRRGVTRGAVDDLIDPQKEKNKRRSAEIDIVSKTANGGWEYHEKALDPVQEENLKRFGSRPGINIKWKGEQKPQPIQATAPTQAHDRLEGRADEDIRKISGINEAALGELDKVQSGRALEARQRQAVISIQVYMDNFSRSKRLQGMKHLELIQNHYTEPRMQRVLGEDGKFAQILINQREMNRESGAHRIINDVTVGKYTVSVDEVPLSATFANAQFEEMMTLLEKMGPAIGQHIPLFADLIVDASNLPRKDEWVERMKQIMTGIGVPMGPTSPVPPGGGQDLLNAPSLTQGTAPGGNVVPITPQPPAAR